MKKLIIILLLTGLKGFAQDSTSVKINQLILAYQQLNKFTGTALVASQGKVIFEKGYGYRNEQAKTPNDAATIFQIASVTKTFTSATVLKLIEMHRLSLSDKLSKWYPAFPNAGKITIENLLSHTSGIFDYTHEDTVTHLNNEAKMMTFLAKKPLDFEPGTDWSYSNSGYSILGFIIGKVSGMTYEQAVRHYIFMPLHMNHSGFDFERLKDPEKATGYGVGDHGKVAASYSDSSVVFAAGAIYSTATDIYKWHQGLQAYRIVGKALMDKAYTRFKKSYGYGWIIDSVGNQKMVYHSGNIAGFSSVLVRIPAADICIILLNNQEGTELETIARKILDILYGRPYSLPGKKIAISLPDSVLSRYTGTYDLTDMHMVANVSLENHQLVIHVQGGPTFPLTAEKNNLFYINEGQAEVEFSPGKITISQNGQKHAGKKTNENR
ncbi:serine hydrolase [Mucilaginibacter sp. L3T2-6]|uniref:serine hydrolase domain-containing protein n=1 Tax=Mucilaginibacter sp. L3T2-6 TaxID=3062491 RepID=UPI002674B7A3|nr:serine hydrolase domain-containing protein [Mucilaginibacter sp. L3T2-6]MDO3643974.1 serine hydrolase domain-containing protein [Mucilaginibacter sp. L3T2-6]MDV6216303.1 serine hydrolase domain-containing protein [Mucilaginibacter sp. L3T2-6]